MRVCPASPPCPMTSASCNPLPPFCYSERTPPGDGGTSPGPTALGSNDDACGSQCSQVTFRCPDNGYYRLLTGAANAGDPYVCRSPFPMTSM
jgi:hypothetical protein